MLLQNNFSKEKIANFLIFLIPITYISGNLLLNLNLLIIIIYIFTVYRQQVFQSKLGLIDKFLLVFFVYLILNGFVNNFFNFNFPEAPEQNIILIKSLFYS